MKKSLLIFILFLISSGVMAQDQWKLYCGKKLLLPVSGVDDTTRIVTLNEKELGSGQDLRLEYQSGGPLKEWTRYFSIIDSQGTQLKIFESSPTMIIPLSEIHKMLGDGNRLRLYTWAIPTDPILAARVRVRRVYLCTLAKD